MGSFSQDIIPEVYAWLTSTVLLSLEESQDRSPFYVNGQFSIQLGDILFSPASFILDKWLRKQHPLHLNITSN